MVDLEKYQKHIPQYITFLSNNTIKINVKMKERKKFFQLNQLLKIFILKLCKSK